MVFKPKMERCKTITQHSHREPDQSTYVVMCRQKKKQKFFELKVKKSKIIICIWNLGFIKTRMVAESSSTCLCTYSMRDINEKSTQGENSALTNCRVGIMKFKILTRYNSRCRCLPTNSHRCRPLRGRKLPNANFFFFFSDPQRDKQNLCWCILHEGKTNWKLCDNMKNKYVAIRWEASYKSFNAQGKKKETTK